MNLEFPNCIVCGKNDFDYYLDVKNNDHDESFLLKQCKCSLVLTTPRPCVNSIEKYYDANYLPHSNVNERSFLNKVFRRISYLRKYHLIKNTFKGDVELLDVGGGDGSLALYLKNKISSVHVYEKNKNCINFINKKNIFSTDNFKDLKNNDYNFITMFHSLEHIHEINNLFSNINRVAKKESKMIIAVPNIQAGEIKFLADKWIAWDAPRHLYHFSFQTLSALLDKHGWEVVDLKNMFQDTLFNIYMSLDEKFIKKILLFILLTFYSFMTQVLYSNKQSTNLVICQKK